MELYRKIYSYDYLYLTKLACTTNDEIFQQEAYVNRASIAMDSMARYIIPININPDLLYISDMYYAHYCNELATQISISSGWKYNMKSLPIINTHLLNLMIREDMLILKKKHIMKLYQQNTSRQNQ